MPSYRADVSKVVNDLQSIDAFTGHYGRTLIYQDTVHSTRIPGDIVSLDRVLVRLEMKYYCHLDVYVVPCWILTLCCKYDLHRIP